MPNKFSLVYTASAMLAAAHIKKGFSQRNPDYFAGVEKNVEAVVVIGDFPWVAEAYEKVDGCEVKRIKEPAPKAPAAKKPTAAEAEAQKLQAQRDADRKAIEEGDEAYLKSILAGLETEKDGKPHTITAEELDELDVETLRSMALDVVFIADE